MSTGTVEFPTFEWIVSRNQLSSYYFRELISPECHLPGSSWKLKVSERDCIRIYLLRTDSGPSKVFTCKIRLNFKSRGDILTGDFRSGSFKSRGDILTGDFRSGSYFPNLHIYRSDMQLQTNLIITCYINSNTPQQKAAESQRKDAYSVIGREYPKHEDWSSLDIKDGTLLRERMKELLINGIGHDVTICVQDKEFQAHRSILSSRSPVFAMMLTHDSKENNTGKIQIEDCDPESFDEFLLYVYSGRTENLTPTNALRLYYPADKYDFPILKERCVRILKTSLSVESICDVVLLAAKHQEKELLEVATKFFARNMKKILVTVNWQKFMSQNLVEANELLINSVDIKHSEN